MGFFSYEAIPLGWNTVPLGPAQTLFLGDMPSSPVETTTVVPWRPNFRTLLSGQLVDLGE